MSVSIATLLPGVGSRVPGGGSTAATLRRVPPAGAATVPRIRKSTAPPLRRSTRTAIGPVPDAGSGQREPGEARHVQITSVRVAGTASITVAPCTASGPLLRTTRVYCTVAPGTVLLTPLVLTSVRSAVALPGPGRISVGSVAVLLDPSGSTVPGGPVTVAWFSSVPVAAGSTVARIVKVAVPPARRSTVTSIPPVPAAGQRDPGEAVQVQVTPVSAAGTGSTTRAPVTALGP